MSFKLFIKIVLCLLAFYGGVTWVNTMWDLSFAFLAIISLIGYFLTGFLASIVQYITQKQTQKTMYGVILTTGALFICLMGLNAFTLRLPSIVITPYQLHLVSMGEKNIESLGNEIWLSEIKLNQQMMDLTTSVELSNWNVFGQAYIPGEESPAVLTISNLRDEQVDIQLTKTTYSGIVEVYKNKKHIQTLDLYAEGDEPLIVSMRGSYPVLTSLAYIGIILWLGVIVQIGFSSVYFFKKKASNYKANLSSWIENNKIALAKGTNWFITGLMAYGFITFSSNIKFISLPFATAIGAALTLLVVYLWNNRLKGHDYKDSFRRVSLVLAFIGMTQMSIIMVEPLAPFVKPYSIHLVSKGEKNLQSYGTETWLTQLTVGDELVQLKETIQTGDWLSQSQALVNVSGDIATLTLPNIRHEQVQLEFLKSKYSGLIDIYQNESLVKTIDLYRDSSKYVTYKLSHDHLLLLLPAYVGLFIGSTILVGTFIRAIQWGAKRYLIYPNELKKLGKHPRLQPWVRQVHDTLPHSNTRLGLNVMSYLSLPLLMLCLFDYMNQISLQAKGFFYVLFFIITIGLECLIYKKINQTIQTTEPTSPRLVRIMNIGRAAFYITTVSLLLVSVMAVIYFFPSLDVSINWIETNTSNLLLTTSLIVALIVVIYALTNQMTLSICLVVIVFIVFGIANFYKFLVTGEPIYPADLAMITKMDSILGYVKGILSIKLLIMLGLFMVLLGILSLKLKGPKFKRNPRIFLFIIALAYVVVFCNYEKSFMKPYVKSAVKLEKWNQIANYDQNGVIIGFISNLQTDMMDRKIEYNKQNVQSILLDKQSKIGDITDYTEERPNIVVIVNESFSDPTVLDQLTFSEDPMPNLRRYQSQHPSGNMLSPFKGGGTANVEFEFLTSLSNSFLYQGSVPFQQVLSNKVEFPSFVWYLNDLGYNTTAIHPNNPAFYKRNQVYPALGFNRFISLDELTFTDRIANDFFISDDAMMKETMNILKTETNPSFVYSLTIQNHMPIEDGKFGENSIEVTKSSGERFSEMETYAEGLKQSDQALEKFLSELEIFEEPTVVVFFGDHLVNFQDPVHHEHGHVNRNPDGNVAKTFYQTPLLIWSNQGALPMESMMSVSPNFLVPLLIQALDLPMTPLYQLVLDVYDTLGALHPDFILDRDENHLLDLTKEQKQRLLDYELIEYDILQGKEYTRPFLFEHTN